MLRFSAFWLTLIILLNQATLVAQDSAQQMPREDVVEVQAIGEGLCVSNVFQSDMVLQRDKPISIWGWADTGEQVIVSFGGNDQTITAAEDRTWKVTPPEIAANTEPQAMTIKDANKTLTLDNILVGDVWLHEWSDWFGQHYRKGDWDECSPEIVRELSAIGYVFARRIHMASQVPIGVIDASRGDGAIKRQSVTSLLAMVARTAFG